MHFLFPMSVVHALSEVDEPIVWITMYIVKLKIMTHLTG